MRLSCKAQPQDARTIQSLTLCSSDVESGLESIGAKLKKESMDENEEWVNAENEGDLNETQPSPVHASRTRIPLWRLFGVASLGVGIIIVLILISLPTLLSPPPEASPGYELLLLGPASVRLDPEMDHLVSTADGLVTVFIPKGIDVGPGTLTMLPRRDEFIPNRLDDGLVRIRAVDLFVVRPDGEVLSSVDLGASILLCFSVNIQSKSEGEIDGSDFIIERHAVVNEDASWQEIPQSPGWEDGQVCSALKSLSLYALTQILESTSDIKTLPTETPMLGGGIMDLYGIPTPTDPVQ